MGPRGSQEEASSSCTATDSSCIAPNRHEESALLSPISTRTSGCTKQYGATERESVARFLVHIGCSRVVIVTLVILLGVIACVQRVELDTATRTTLLHQNSEPDPILKLQKSSAVQGLKHGAVASDHPLCSQMGIHVLETLGGNVVDAAIATILCLGVANPASSGIGGGMFILVHADRKHHDERWANNDHKPEFVDARSKEDIGRTKTYAKITEVIDAREVAPDASYTEMFLDAEADSKESGKFSSEKGSLAIAVLGELRGLELAHARHGLLAWSTLVEPAMLLARDGVVVRAHLASDIAGQRTNFATYGMTDLANLLTKNNDGKTFLKRGEILRNPALAKTLELVMKKGADAIYKGELAKSIAVDVQKAGGILTESDINAYQATLRSPLISEAFGFTVVGVPPPSSGGATIIGVLRFLAGFKAPLASFADTVSIHRIVEAMRHAFAIRMSLSDPDYFPEVVAGATNDLISGNYMEELRLLHQDNATLRLSQFGGSKWAKLNEHEGQKEPEDAHEGDRMRRLGQQEGHRQLYRKFGYLDDHGTTHLSVVDSQGNAVSVTSSVNTYFGSGVVSKSTGIILNNQMDDFGNPGKPNYYGLRPSEGNFIKPRKKPLSSMAPTLLLKKTTDDNSLGDMFMAVGASGGPKIISSVMQVIVNHALLGMPLFEAVSHPRVHDQLLYHGSDVTCTEKDPLDQGPTIRVSNRTRAALAKRGHNLIEVDYTGTVQAVAVDLETNTLSAVSDIRKGGTPAGY